MIQTESREQNRVNWRTCKCLENGGKRLQQKSIKNSTLNTQKTKWQKSLETKKGVCSIWKCKNHYVTKFKPPPYKNKTQLLSKHLSEDSIFYKYGHDPSLKISILFKIAFCHRNICLSIFSAFWKPILWTLILSKAIIWVTALWLQSLIITAKW